MPGSFIAYFLTDLMSHDSEIIRELLFAKNHLSNKINVTYQFEIKDRSSSDGEKGFTKNIEKDNAKITR